MRNGRIDVHHHYSTAAFREHLAEAGFAFTRINQEIWAPESALKVMDANGTAFALLSLARPGVHLGDPEAGRKVARACNEAAAEIVQRWSDRFGFFAVLTLPDVEGSISELQYAMDELGADGVCLLTNAHGLYLGDALFDPLMTELDARAAVVLVHPTHLPGSDDLLLPGLPVPGIPVHLIDYPHDTTRAAVNMVRNGVPERFRNVRIILPHAGGTVPYLADRIAQMGSATDADRVHTPAWTAAALRSFYFDVALSTSPWALGILMDFAAQDHVIFGSDYPAVPLGLIQHFRRQLESSSLLSPVDLARIDRANAMQLFPRLASMLDA